MNDSNPYRIHIYSDVKAFGQLSIAWNDLTGRDKFSSAFQTWTWISQIWKLEAEGDTSPILVTIFDKDNNLVALAPLLIERRFGILNIRILRLIGHRISDRQDIIIASDADEFAVVKLLAEWFVSVQKFYDIIILDNLSEDSRIFRYIERLLPKKKFVVGNKKSTDDYLYIPIVGSWEDYSKGLRRVGSEIRRKKRRLEEKHTVNYWTEDGSIDPQKSIADFVKLHQRRLESKKERGLFRSDVRERILSDLFIAMLKDGKMRLRFIDVDGLPTAAQVVLEYNDRVHWYSVGLDPSPNTLRLGIGKLLCSTAVEEAFKTGKSEIDLGSGIQPYKKDFASHIRKNYNIVLFYSPVKGFIYRVHEWILRKLQNSKAVRNLYFLVRRSSFSS